MIITKARLAIAALTSALAGAAVPTAIILQGEGGVQYIPRIETAPDSTCLIEGGANRDSVGKFYLNSTKETKVQLRASARLDALFAARCVTYGIVVDTILPDTVTQPPPIPEDSAAIVNVVLHNQTGDTLRIRPFLPFIIFYGIEVDSAGQQLSDSALVTLSDTSMAKLHRNKTSRMYEVYTLTTHTKTGPLIVQANYNGAVTEDTLYIVATAAPPPPPDTLPPDTVWSPPPLPDSTSLGRIAYLFGHPTRTEASARAVSLWGLDSLFQRWEPFRWTADSTSGWPDALWSAANYYDRCQIYYAFYARTGNPVYKKRGDDICLSYRQDYLEPNKYSHALWWWMPDGQALHYLFTGDTMSRRAVGQGTKVLEGYFARMPYPGDVNIDGRNRARLIQSYLLSWQLNYPKVSPLPWSTYLDSMVTMMYQQQTAEGAWVDANRCYTQATFLGAMQVEQLQRVYDLYKPDPRILTMVKKALDFMWLQVLRPANAPMSFAYVNEPCPTNGDYRIPAPDINGFFPHVYAWYGAKSGDRTYIARADSILKATIQGIYPQGSKQFNQAFAVSWRSLHNLP